jgi:hypothetical protein
LSWREKEKFKRDREDKSDLAVLFEIKPHERSHIALSAAKVW